jgi:valyl-tRNA synthetase
MEKQYDSKKSEQAAQAYWEQNKTYHRDNNPGQLCSIDTPPPTVSGSLHIGHLFSYTQTDIIARFKRMEGFSVFYPFGFDDNGLPTERFVEKKRDIVAHKLSRTEFINICLEETQIVEKQFEQLWRSMGLSVDWAACYSTISASTRKISQESFIRLYKKGYVYRKNEPAPYCTTDRTSVAQAELDDKEIASTFNDIVFKTTDGKELVIGTTRPELLPSCVALLYNPTDSRYQQLKGEQAIVPIFNTTVPILADEAVAVDKGTGLVMCCTFGDKTDIAWFKKFNLPFKQSVGLDGRWTEQTGILVGLKVHDARAKILEALKEQGLLRNQRPITHSVNVHERCKKEIEFALLSQWFINILDHKQQFLNLADQINWYPAFMKPRYVDWVTNLSWDWCISRQRFFGIPFPAWHCKGCSKVLLPELDQLPIDPQETPYSGKKCPHCSSSDIVPDTDVMDTWNTSSLTPYLCQALYYPLSTSQFEPTTSFLPMSIRPQAHDIIRTWAFDTIVKTWMHQEQIPWKDIVISGHVLSGTKEKLSKSKDNASLSPERLLETYSADVIRYWTASGSLGHDTPFSDNQLKIGQRLVTKIWNAFRFIHEHTQQVDLKQEPKNLGVINEWLLHSMSTCFGSYHRYFETNEFGLALDTVEKFFWHSFCDNYLELVKDQLFNPALYDEQQVAATRWTLNVIGLRLLQLYAPYLPHVTETLYSSMYQKNYGVASIHQTKFSALQKVYAFPDSADSMHLVIAVTNEVRKLKTQQQLSLKVELHTLIIHASDAQALALLKKQEQLIKGVSHAHAITYQTMAAESALTKRDEQWHATVQVGAV